MVACVCVQDSCDGSSASISAVPVSLWSVGVYSLSSIKASLYIYIYIIYLYVCMCNENYDSSLRLLCS